MALISVPVFCPDAPRQAAGQFILMSNLLEGHISSYIPRGLPEHPPVIVHIDMDAFFAAVEQRDNPALGGRPVVVGADPRGGRGRGVVSTCSYEARRFGIRSAMPISQAYRLCPGAVFIRPDIAKYSAVSRQIRRILDGFTPVIEQVGIDEAFLDITETYRLFSPAPVQTCVLMKDAIRGETGLTASVGIAPTKMAAKIASDLKKPDGLVEVCPDALLEFLWPLEIGRLWGLGPKSEKILRERGVRTIGDLAHMDERELSRLFGRNGTYFYELARGRDARRVECEKEAKSISAEHTFDRDTRDAGLIHAALMRLSEEVSGRLRQDKLKGRTVTLKIRLSGFQTFTRAKTLPESVNYSDVIAGAAKELYRDFAPPEAVRLVGVRVSNLIPADQRESLFTDRKDAARERVHGVVETIRRRFGSGAIQRAGSLKS